MGSIPPPPKPPQFLVIGAGSRGTAYARAVTASTPGTIAAIAEPDEFKRNLFGRKYIWGSNITNNDTNPTETQPQIGQSFIHWQDYINWEVEYRRQHDNVSSGITGVFVCTLDETHIEIMTALAPLGLHILCEKPLALSLRDCLSISRSLSMYPPQKIVSIGHVLRYSPHNMLLRDLLVNRQVIGEVVSMEHTEPVGWWHFSHSYVRGNWRRETQDGVGSLLTKSCHDIDFILWLLCSPSLLTGDRPHLPSSVMSHGALTHFRKGRKPAKAGTATNCLSCPAEPECMYSAKKIYVEKKLRGEKDTGWPVKIVAPEIEDIVRSSGMDAAEERLLENLAEDYDDSTPREDVRKRGWYGRCVYESDNNVMDDQSVTVTWDDENDYGRGPKQALFHMTYPTKAQCERRGRIYGSTGEIEYDSRTITVHSFINGETTKHAIPKQDPEVEKSHGGGDWGLAGAFVKAVQAVDNGEMDVKEAQTTFVGCDIEEIIRSHALVFAAEEARIKKEVVNWRTWWSEKHESASQAL